jgi:ribosomal protein S6
MSFREIAVTIRAVNRASHEFARIQTDAEALSALERKSCIGGELNDTL